MAVSSTSFESTFTQEVADEIVRRIATGEPLAAICRDTSGPFKFPKSRHTVSNWRKVHEDFDEAMNEARDDGYDLIAQRLRATARGLTADKGGDSTNDVQRDKLIIDTDLKLLAKWDSRRYGDRVALDHGAQGSLESLILASMHQAALPPPDQG